MSVRTAYRYFPTKEALIESFNEWVGKQWGSPPLPTSIEELPAMAAGLLESFERNEHLVRAGRQSEHGAKLRKLRKVGQVKAMKRVVTTYAPFYDDAAVEKVVGVLLNLLSSEAWLAMRDNLGLSTPQCIESVQWGIAAIVAKIDSERPHKGRK